MTMNGDGPFATFESNSITTHSSSGSSGWFRNAVGTAGAAATERTESMTRPELAKAEGFGIAEGSHGIQILTARVRAELEKFRGLIDPYPGRNMQVEIGGHIIGLLDSNKLTHWVIPHHWVGIPNGGLRLDAAFHAKTADELVQLLALDQAERLGLVVTDGNTNLYFPGEEVTMNSAVPLPPAIKIAVSGIGLTTEGLRQAVRKYGVAAQGLNSRGNKVALKILKSPLNAIGGIGSDKSLTVKRQVTEGSERLNRFEVGGGVKGVGFLHTHFDFTEQEIDNYPLVKQLLSRGMPLQTLLELNSTQDMGLLHNKNLKTQSGDITRQVASGVIPVIRKDNGEIFVGPPRFFSLKGMAPDTAHELSQILGRALAETNPDKSRAPDAGVLYEYFQMMDQLSLPRGVLPDYIGMNRKDEPFMIPSLDFASVHRGE